MDYQKNESVKGHWGRKGTFMARDFKVAGTSFRSRINDKKSCLYSKELLL